MTLWPWLNVYYVFFLTDLTTDEHCLLYIYIIAYSCSQPVGTQFIALFGACSPTRRPRRPNKSARRLPRTEGSAETVTEPGFGLSPKPCHQVGMGVVIGQDYRRSISWKVGNSPMSLMWEFLTCGPLKKHSHGWEGTIQVDAGKDSQISPLGSWIFPSSFQCFAFFSLGVKPSDVDLTWGPVWLKHKAFISPS